MGRIIPFALPLPIRRHLARLGEQIRLARQRRQLAMELVAERAGISRVTLGKVERGDPNVTLGAYARVLHALGLADDLTLLARDDLVGRALQDAQVARPVPPRRRRLPS